MHNMTSLKLKQSCISIKNYCLFVGWFIWIFAYYRGGVRWCISSSAILKIGIRWTYGPKQIKIEVPDSDVPDQKHTQTENSDSDVPDQKYIKIESSDSDAPNSKHIKIGSSDSDEPDPKHITIEDSNSDASLGDLPILEPPKKVRRGYECNQESDFLPGLTSSSVQQFKCEPTDVDDDFPTVMMPTSTFCIEDPKLYFHSWTAQWQCTYIFQAINKFDV